uniref:Uncharacterized protein n=1 Tax=Arundo donax TaxID=35708 RepID=A0A0A9H1D4_ARUDO
MVQNCENGRSAASHPSNCNNTSTSLSPKTSCNVSWKGSRAVDRIRPSSEASVSETVPVIPEQAHGYHCSSLDLELGMSLSTPSIGT